MSQYDVMMMESRLTKILWQMEKTGIRIDPGFCVRAGQSEVREMEAAKTEFKSLTGRDFKDSNKLFAEVFTENGTPYPVTEKGNPSFNADALEAMDDPIARAIKKYRNHEKRYGTYYTSFLYYADDDSIIHASANQDATKTGRMSYSNPNLQNVPKEDEPEDQEKEFLVRGAFVPRNTFVSIDYDQQEYRMMLDYAGEKKLIAQVLDGADVHQATADLIGLPRKQAKNINFALLYGAGIKKFAAMSGIDEKDAYEIREDYFGKLPGVKNFLRTVKSTGESRGYVYNWLGRQCHINKFEESYKLPNHLIQGGCADVCKTAMLRINERFPESGLCVQVHDELLFDTERFDDIPAIMDIMEDVYKPFNGMRLTVSLDHSPRSWSYRDKREGMPGVREELREESHPGATLMA